MTMTTQRLAFKQTLSSCLTLPGRSVVGAEGGTGPISEGALHQPSQSELSDGCRARDVQSAPPTPTTSWSDYSSDGTTRLSGHAGTLTSSLSVLNKSWNKEKWSRRAVQVDLSANIRLQRS